MNVQIKHSVVQDESVIKFSTLNDYFKCIGFLDESNLKWTPLTYSSNKNRASIRVNEHVLNIITKKFGIYKCHV